MSARALAIVMIIALACDGPTAPAIPQHPGLEGLHAHLDAARRSPERAVDSWRFAEDRWRELVTEAYRDHWPTYSDALAERRATLIAALRASPSIPPRLQYADDPSLAPEQVRLRWVLPVGSPGVIADGIPAVFFHDGTAWRALVSLDGLMIAAADRVAPGCAAAYLDTSAKPCGEWAWAIAEGALRYDDARVRRACGNAMAQGCGAGGR